MNIQIDLLPGQKTFLESNAKFPALVGGLGSGKTEGGIMKIIVGMLRNPGANFAYYMPTHDLLSLRAIPGFIEVLEKFKLKYKVNKHSGVLNVHGFGDIIFRSYSQPERIIAYETFGAIVDELDTLPMDKAELVWRKIVERNRQVVPNAVDNNFIGSVTTPDQGVHGFIYSKWGDNPGKGYELTKARTIDNSFLPDEYVEQIRSNYDPILADLYLNGEFVNLSRDTVYYNFKRDHNHAHVEFDHSDDILVGLDFNVKGCATTIAVEDESTDELFFINEFTERDTYKVAERLRRLYGKHRDIIIHPDATGKHGSTNSTVSDLDILRSPEYGFSVLADNGNPRVRDRVVSVNHGFYNKTIWVDTKACPRLTAALELQGYDSSGKPEKFEGPATIDDWTDSAGYLIHKRKPIARPSFMQYKTA